MCGMDESVSRFIARLPHVRKARGLSASKLAELAQQRDGTLTHAVIANLETGRKKLLLSEALTLCAVLDVSLAEMTGQEPISVRIDCP